MKDKRAQDEVLRMHDQLKRAFEGTAWSGPAVLGTLRGVTAARAMHRPIPKAHSIWEITLHIAAWEEAVRRRLGGERWSPGRAENFPKIADPSPRAWQAARKKLIAGHQALRETVLRLLDADLGRIPVPGGSATAYMQIHGIIQHDLYHAGQIAILRKGKPPVAVRPPAKPRKTGRRKSR